MKLKLWKTGFLFLHFGASAVHTDLSALHFISIELLCVLRMFNHCCIHDHDGTNRTMSSAYAKTLITSPPTLQPMPEQQILARSSLTYLGKRKDDKTPDLDSRLAYPRPRPRLAYSRPRPRPRLSSFKTKTKTCLSKTKTKTKTSMSKTKTETQDLQDQYWKSMTGMNCDKQNVMASRKSSIPVVAHSKQKTSYYV